jgi:RHS repeat-associated protein
MRINILSPILLVVLGFSLWISNHTPFSRSTLSYVGDGNSDAKEISSGQQLASGLVQASSDYLPLRVEKWAGSGAYLHLPGAGLAVPDGAMSTPGALSITALRIVDIPALDHGIVNVTGPYAGYRFLPHGSHFIKPVTISLDYDEAKIPSGYTPNDIFTFYFDTETQKWIPLVRKTVDQVNKKIVSTSTHFTDMINAIIQVPEAPVTQANTPNTMSGIQYPDPASQILTIEAPTANSSGSAVLEYPIKLPAGRNGMQPDVTVEYNSGGGDGWMGLGWDLGTPAVSIETRWGVPRYDPDLETETYTLEGAQLFPVAHRAKAVSRSTGDKQFYPRVNNEFQKIIRHGKHPREYWWEVTDKNGVRRFFGGNSTSDKVDPSSVLTDASGNVAYWALSEARDPNGNFIKYKYTKVVDPGTPGGNLGYNLYPSSIRYTGHGTDEGEYTVIFTRDRDLGGANRKDIIISGRLGFKQVTADLLRKVQVQYKGQDIRSYQLSYTEGAFYKTLLQTIREFDAGGKLFTTHTMNYYDDVRGKSDVYEPLLGQEEWNPKADNVQGTFLTPDNPVFNDRASALSGNTSIGGGFNMAVTIGLNDFNLKSKTSTAGVSFGFDVGTNEGMLALVDINGDGLLDKVYKKRDFLNGPRLTYRANQSALNGNTEFGPELPIKGISNFSQGLTWGVNVGLESNFFVWAGLGYKRTENITNVYLSDVNGDQLIDIVSNGTVYFNHLDQDGNPNFSPSSSNTPSPIKIASPGIDQTLVENDPKALDSTIDANPLHDVVKVWIAPFDGTVNINAPVALFQDPKPEAQSYTPADGVRVAIQHKGTELWSEKISATDFTPKNPSGVGSVVVKKGDRIYFRVQSVFDGAYDHVSWVPEITYSNHEPGLNDANDLPIFQFQSDKDFLMAAALSVGMPIDGTIRISGDFTKPVTSDNVVITLLKKAKSNGAFTTLLQQQLSWDQAVSLPVSVTQQVFKDDELFFRVSSETNIDWTALHWEPVVYYTASNDPKVPKVLDDDNNPLIQFAPTVDFQAYTKTARPSIPWTAPTSDTYTIEAKPKLNPNFLNGQLVFSVKKNKELIAKQVIPVTNGVVALQPALTAEFNSGDKVFFEYHTRDTNLVKVMDSTTVITDTDPGTPDTLLVGLHTLDSIFIFGPQYRHWGQFAYNGNRDRANQPILESDLKLNDALMMDQDPPLDLSSFVNENDPEGSSKLAETSYDARGGYQPEKDKFIYMAPDNKRKAWVGYDNYTFVTRDTISSSRMGRDDILPINPITGSGQVTDPGGAVGIKKVAQSDNFNVGVATLGGALGVSGSVGTTKFLYDFNDMNGDGYPDILSNSKVQYTHPYGVLRPDATNISFGDVSYSEHYSVGATAGGKLDISSAPNSSGTQKGANAANAQLESAVAAGVNASFGGNFDKEKSAFLDINGDGLPDRVSADGKVQLNMGYSFLPPEPWGYAGLSDGRSLSLGGGVSISLEGGSISAGVSLTRSDNVTTNMLLDVNGDGLTDYIQAINPLTVRINTGNGFGPAIEWKKDGAVNNGSSTGESANIGFTVGITLIPPIPIFKLMFNPSITISQGADRSEVQFNDIDGDGFPDYLQSVEDGKLTVSRSSIRRTNLLKKVSRPLGGSFTLNYKRLGNTYQMPNSVWTLSRVDEYDGVPGDGPEFTSKTFAYSEGRYDRNEREFYGFGKVITEDRDTNKDDKVFRASEENYFTDNYYRTGLLSSEVVSDSLGKKFTETKYRYQLKDVPTGTDLSNDFKDDDGAAFPALVKTERLFYEGKGTAGKTTSTSFQYDVLGNMTGSVDFGDPGANDDLSTAISYHSVPGKYIMNVPSSVTVTGNGQVYRQRATKIDNNTGNIEETRLILKTSVEAVYTMTYDVFGNLKTIERPENAAGDRLKYTYEYDTDVNIYVTKTTDSYEYTSSAVYDHRFGEPLSITDINGQQTQYTLDDAGRVRTIREPLEIASGQPFTIAFEYHPEAIVPWALARHFDPANPTNFMETAAFKDGIGRQVQTKKDIALFTAAQSPDEEVMVVSGSTTFDAFGRPIVQYYEITEPKGSSISVYNPNADDVTPHRMSYDVLDRMLTDTIQNETILRTEYGFGSDRNGIQQFDIKSFDGNGIYTHRFYNARGLLTSSKQQYSQGSDVWTSYAYSPVNELTNVTDDLNNVITMGYDRLGRKISDVHPDAGLTTYKYDLAGNLIEKITANLQEENAGIKYSYDRERLTSIIYPQNTQNNVTLSYGAAGAPYFRTGRVVTQQDATGTQEFFYDQLGATVKNVRVIKVPDTTALTYTTQWTYDTWNRLTGMVYPDGEVLTYKYNLGGLLQSMSGTKDGITYNYMPQTGYNKFERRTYMRYGNKTEMTWEFDRLFSNLVGRLTATTSNGRYMMDNAYAYDEEINILGIVNSAEKPPSNLMGGSGSYVYKYDDMYRLINVTGTFGGSSHEHRYSMDMEYNTVSSILRKTQLHERKGYDETAWTRQNKTSYDNQYSYNASGQPHAPIQIGRQAFTHDANGNQTSWQDDISAQNREIVWDEENRIRELSDNGELLLYGYDASGTRVYKSKGNQQTVSINGKKAAQTSGTGNYTIYVNPYGEVYSGGYTKHVFIEGQRIASTLVTTSAGNKQQNFQYYYHPDHLGNSSYITDASGEVYQHLEYFPFGESFVVEQSNGQRTPYLYNGKELDDVTGLYYYGARYYDPVTSIWESVDPSWDLPQQVDESPYAYVGNNPVVFFDPDGRVRYFGRAGVFSLLRSGQFGQRDNGIDLSYLSKFKSPRNIPGQMTRQNQRQQGARAGTLSTYSGTRSSITNNGNSKTGYKVNATLQLFDLVDINLYSNNPDDDPKVVILRDILDFKIYRKSSPNGKTLSQQLRERRQEKQQMYMSNLRKAQRAILNQPGFKTALKTFTQLRARGLRAK